MTTYSQAEAARILKSAQTNLLRWVQRRQARDIDVPGVNPDGSYTDEFLDYYRSEQAAGVTCTGGRMQRVRGSGGFRQRGLHSHGVF